jgi:Asp-tRNA(Asn)/Glu-tRNA(Gln) amidotransferase A subunit family amidase
MYASAEVQASTKSVEQLLKRQGASIVDITIPHLSAAFKAHVVSILTEMRTAMRVDMRAHAPRRTAQAAPLAHPSHRRDRFPGIMDAKLSINAQAQRSFSCVIISLFFDSSITFRSTLP